MSSCLHVGLVMNKCAAAGVKAVPFISLGMPSNTVATYGVKAACMLG